MKKTGRLAGQDLLQGVGLEFPVQGTLDGRQLPVGDAVPLALPPRTGVVRLHAGGNGAGLSQGQQQVVQGDLGQVRRQPASPSRPPRDLDQPRLAELFDDLIRKGLGQQLPLGQFTHRVQLTIHQGPQDS